VNAAAVISEGRIPGPAFDELPWVEVAPGPLHEVLREPRPGVRAAIVVGSRVDAALLDLFPDLALVARYGIGYDAVDVEACSARGVAVAITPGPVEVATAELTVALILAVRRRLLAIDATVRGGGWAPPVTELPAEEGIHAATVGLLGFGRIARRVAAATAALGARIIYTTRTPAPAEVEAAVGAEWVPLEELCSRSDVLSVHCPLNEETRGMIGAEQLGLMRDRAALVNTARGPIVEERALIAEVGAGRLEAGLDVFDAEPSVPPELRESPHVLLSPHAGSATRAAREQMTRICVDNVLAVLAGEPAPNLVPEQAAERA
jgi:glyoxylate reductase